MLLKHVDYDNSNITRTPDIHWCPSVGLMLCQRRRRWSKFNPTLVQRLVFAGKMGEQSE